MEKEGGGQSKEPDFLLEGDLVATAGPAVNLYFYTDMTEVVYSGVPFSRAQCKVVYRDAHKNVVKADAGFPVPMVDWLKMPKQGAGTSPGFQKSPPGPYKCVLDEDNGYFHYTEEVTLIGTLSLPLSGEHCYFCHTHNKSLLSFLRFPYCIGCAQEVKFQCLVDIADPNGFQGMETGKTAVKSTTKLLGKLCFAALL